MTGSTAARSANVRRVFAAARHSLVAASSAAVGLVAIAPASPSGAGELTPFADDAGSADGFGSSVGVSGETQPVIVGGR